MKLEILRFAQNDDSLRWTRGLGLKFGCPIVAAHRRTPPSPVRVQHEYEAVLTGENVSMTAPDFTYVEIPIHPFFLGCQFHPEFKS
jgi:Glutamine amidotransferase class-I